MTSWDELLRILAERPRENGSAALRDTTTFLFDSLEKSGLDPSMFTFAAHPYRLRIAGLVALLGGLLYAALIRGRRPGAALLVAVALPLVLLLELDFYVPVFGWPGAERQHHVEVTIAPSGVAEQRVVLTAHFDTKTDLLDHVERAPIELLALPVGLLMVAGALVETRRRRNAGPGSRSRWASAAAGGAVLLGVAMFLALTAGAFVRERSKGALDDGAACAVLFRLAERLAGAPLQRTEVDVVFLSAEEIGVEGSWIYARSRFAEPPPVPTVAINLENIGAAPDHGVFRREQFSLRSFAPDPDLVELLDEVHRRVRGEPLYVPWYGASTDARSFLAHGVRAATLFSEPSDHPLPRGLHSAADDRDRVAVRNLEATQEYLAAVLTEADATSGIVSHR